MADLIAPREPHLLPSQLPPLPRPQPANPQLPNRTPHQPQRRMSHRRRHPPHLPVPSLPQRHLQPPRRNRLAIPDRRFPRRQLRLFIQHPHLSRLRPHTLDLHTPSQPLQSLFPRNPLHLHPIRARMPKPRRRQPVLQRPIIRQQQQSFAVMIQTPRRIDPRYVQIILQRSMRRTRLRRKLAQYPIRLVEQNVARHLTPARSPAPLSPETPLPEPCPPPPPEPPPQSRTVSPPKPAPAAQTSPCPPP